MKKLLFAAILAFGSFAAVSYAQEPCNTPEPCNNPVPCEQPAPCDTVPCNPAPCNPGC